MIEMLTANQNPPDFNNEHLKWQMTKLQQNVIVRWR